MYLKLKGTSRLSKNGTEKNTESKSMVGTTIDL